MRNEQFKTELKRHSGRDIDQLFEEISVMNCDDMADNFDEGSEMHILNTRLRSWYAVVNSQGIIAYFGEEAEAYKFRLDYISRIMNY